MHIGNFTSNFWKENTLMNAFPFEGNRKGDFLPINHPTNPV